MAWTKDDEMAYLEHERTDDERTKYFKKVFTCKTCGSEYAKHLKFCPGCVDKARQKLDKLGMFLLMVSGVLRGLI